MAISSGRLLPGGCKFIPASLAVLLLLTGTSCSGNLAAKKAEAASPTLPLRVKVAQVENKELRRTVESVGSLFAYDEVIVSSQVDGPVDAVLADVGDRVHEGQPLARISPVEFQL